VGAAISIAGVDRLRFGGDCDHVPSLDVADLAIRSGGSGCVADGIQSPQQVFGSAARLVDSPELQLLGCCPEVVACGFFDHDPAVEPVRVSVTVEN
jgi:hypothetical protein